MTYPMAMSRLVLAARPIDLHRDGPQWKCRCPAHNDLKASLAIRVGDNGGLLIHCHAGCTEGNNPKPVLDAWGVPWSVLFPDDPEPAAVNGVAPAATRSSRPRGEPEAVYDYVDADGALLFQVCRLAGKEFRQRRPVLGGEWAWNLQHTRRVLYRLPEILAAPPETVIWLCEGEKDADRLRAEGLVATTSPGGAKKWRAEYGEALRGRRVIILPDNDDPGREHASRAAQALRGMAHEVVVLELEGLSEHGDVSDWLDGGHTTSELLDRAKRLEGQVAPEFGMLFASVEPEPVRWLWPSYLALGKISIIVGPPGDGKTMVALDLCARLTVGAPWPNGHLNHEPPCGIVYCSAEDDLADTLLPRFLEAGGDASKALALSTVGSGSDEHELYLPEDIAHVEQAIQRVGARVVVIDPWGGFLSGKLDGNYDQSVRQAMRPLKAMAERREVAVLVVMHPNKNTGTTAMYRAAGSLGTVAAARIVYACGRDPEHQETRVIAPIKVNLTAPPPSLAFTTVEGEKAVRVEWNTDPVELSAEDVLKPAMSETRRNSATNQAKAFLQLSLVDQAVDRDTVVQQVMDVAGCSERTVKRAAQELGIVSRRTGFGQHALWMLPGFRPPEEASAQSGQDDQSGQSGHSGRDGNMAQLDLPTPDDDSGQQSGQAGPAGLDGPTVPTEESGPTVDETLCPRCGSPSESAGVSPTTFVPLLRCPSCGLTFIDHRTPPREESA